MSFSNTSALLVAAYVAPLILLGLLLLRTRLAQWQKALLLAFLPLFYIAHYQGLEDLVGWPSHERLPQTFALLGQQVREPDKQHGTPGYIRLWVRAEGEERSRLYQMAYSKDMHQRLADAKQRQARGIQQIGRQVAATGNERASGQPVETIRFEDRQTPRPPAKASEPETRP